MDIDGLHFENNFSFSVILQQPNNQTLQNKLVELFNYTFCGYDIHDENYNIVYDINTYHEDFFGDYALDFIDKNHNKPFFIYYGSLTPHVFLSKPPLISDIDYSECTIYTTGREILCQVINIARGNISSNSTVIFLVTVTVSRFTGLNNNYRNTDNL